MGGFLAEKEAITRERIKEILTNKEYSFMEQTVTLLGVEGENLVLKISFLLEYRGRMIVIEERDRIVVPFADFRVEDWGDGIRKIADIDSGCRPERERPANGARSLTV
jgi:hypothetical protein